MSNNKDNKQVKFGIDLNKTPVYYADGYLIGSGQHVVTLNFTQVVPGDTQQQNIISRVALTREQAKGFVKDLQNHIDKYEV